MARHRPPVTLLTDFGSQDPYPAAMKGVLLGRCPGVQIVDISHNVPPQNVLAGSLVLEQAAPWFPPETIHVVVVDPGVGTDRAILVGRYSGQTYIFPDNGVITLVAERGPAELLVSVRNPALVTGRAPSMTFHGRDVFAPLAAELLNGQDPMRFGGQPASIRLLDLPPWGDEGEQIVGQVIYVDGFGNLVTNIPAAAVQARWNDLDSVRGACAGQWAGAFQGAYGFVEAGRPLILFNSMGRVELAVNQGRAADVLQAGVGSEVRLWTE